MAAAPFSLSTELSVHRIVDRKSRNKYERTREHN